jgi:hypothetical protein
MKRFIVPCVAAAFMAVPVRAQQVPDLVLARSAGRYFAIGGGVGNFTLDCDAGCAGDPLSSSAFGLVFGRQFGARWRFELGGWMQKNSDKVADLTTLSGGAAVYLVGNLYVRGAATYNRVSVEDTNATFEGSGGPGFTVGAGYDLFIGDRTAITPFVNYVSASLSTIDISAPGGAASTTSGSVNALNFGVTIGRTPRDVGVCVAPDGRRVSRSDRAAFTACIAEVGLWLSSQGRTK